jgi:hypothetical protein
VKPSYLGRKSIDVLRSAHLLIALSVAFAISAQTFETTLGSPVAVERGHCVAKGPNGEIYIGGSIGDSAMVMRVDANGDPLWCVAFKPSASYPCITNFITTTANGDIVGCGNGRATLPAYFWDGFHFRIDPAGNMVWCQMWNDPRPVYTMRIVPLPQAQWLITGGVYDMTASTFADVYTAWVDPMTGAVTSITPLLDQFSSVPYIDDIVDVVAADNGFYTTSRISVGGAPYGKFRAFVARYDANGVHQWTRTLLHNGTQTARMYGTNIIANDDSLTLLVSGDPVGISANFICGLVRMDFQGNIAWARQFDLPGSMQEMNGNVLATGDGYLISGKSNLNGNDLFLMGISLAGHVQWCKSYGGSGIEQYGDIRPDPLIADSSGLWMVGTRVSGADEDIYLLRMDSIGNMVCGTGQLVNVVEAPFSNFSQLTSTMTSTAVVASLAVVGSSAPKVQEACALLPWLGNDSTLCDSILLDPGIAGAQYLWQDGTTDQTLHATAPGVYWVEVSQGCCVAADTIILALGGQPVAAFTYVQDPMDPLNVIFTNTSINADQTTWLIDGTSFISDSLEYAYGATGHYTVCLIAQNACGADTTCLNVYVFPMGVVHGEPLLDHCVAWFSAGEVHCRLPDDGPWSISICDATGRVVNSTSVVGDRCSVPVSSTSGTYQLVAWRPDGRCAIARFAILL